MTTEDEDKASGMRAAVPGTAAFGKFMRVLQAIADASSAVGVASLAKQTGLPRPTTHRIVAALLAEGLVVEAADGGGLVPGPRLISLAHRSWDRSDLRHAARDPLAALRDTLDETVHLAVRSGQEMVYIDKLESRRAVRMASRIGARAPLHSSAVGKAWLAALPDRDLAELLLRLELVARTPFTLTDADALAEDVARTRAQGYAVDRQENELDICCYGHAIVGGQGHALGCISVSLPRYRFDERPAASVTEAMARCAAAIAAASTES